MKIELNLGFHFQKEVFLLGFHAQKRVYLYATHWTSPGVMGFDAHKNKYQNGKYHSNKYLRFVVTCKSFILFQQIIFITRNV